MTTRRVNALVAAALGILTFGIYLKTVAPSLSFWDCGEFIACSFIMGIPHPPGSPLLSLMGRVMSLIPFYDFRGGGFADIAYRINLIDVVLGALTVSLTYLVLVKLMRSFTRALNGALGEALVIITAAVGALTAAFADEFWTNAVETETYMPSLFISMLALWLTLRWRERSDDPGATRYLFLAAYLIGLGNGIHLTVLLIAPTVLLIVLFTRPDWFSDIRLWIGGGVVLIAAAMLKAFAELEFLYMVMALLAFAGPFVLHRMHRRRLSGSSAVFAGLMLCVSLYVIGFSVYPSVMVRASKHPSINEGDPATWNRYKYYMAREQYGQENMYVGMFARKASAYYQFSYMYMRYLLQQFPSWGPTIVVPFDNDRSATGPEGGPVHTDVQVSVLLVTILLYGLYTHAREDWRTFCALMLFFLASSIGLALYLNMDNPQVRERAYFFLGSYHIAMVWIATGIFGLINDVNDWLASRSRTALMKPVTVGLAVVFATLPATAVFSRHLDPGFTNYEVHDRTHDWSPWDYGYNILTSCEQDAILFTNGDNDTFPLWYLQEVAGVRRDVRIVNLSLLNTDWYILQLKNEGAKPLSIGYSDDYISNRLCGSTEQDISLRIWPVDGKKVTAAGIEWTLPAYHIFPISQNEKIGLLRIQDVMIYNILNWNEWKRPVYFAVTVANENKIHLDDYLAMEGMVYRVNSELVPPEHMGLAPDVMYDNMFTKYQYRSLGDPTIYKQPNTLNLVTNYFVGFAQLAEYYARTDDMQKAAACAWAAIEKTPNDLERRILLYRVLAASGFDRRLGEFLGREAASPDFGDEPVDGRLAIYAMYRAIGMTASGDSLVATEADRLKETGAGLDAETELSMMMMQTGFNQPAADYIADIVTRYPLSVEAWKMYAALMYTTGRFPEARAAADKLAELAPDDRTAQETRAIILEELDRQAPPDTTNPASVQ